MPQQDDLPASANLAFIEGLYESYRRDPASVSAQWRDYFQEWDRAQTNGRSIRTEPSFQPVPLLGDGRARLTPSDSGRLGMRSATGVGESEAAAIQDRVAQLIRNYRVRGHIMSQLDPLGLPRPMPPELDPAHYGFSPADMQRRVSTRFMGGAKERPLGQLIESLRSTYCRSIGVQFMHIDDLAVREWLQERMEASENRIELSRKEQFRILTRLTDAVIFEQFVQKKYVGAKTFSLEGAETLIPLLDLAIERAGDQGIVDIVLGMAHRGRLNVLLNIMGKSASDIFREFEDTDPTVMLHGGDVKYHMGHSNDWKTLSGRKVHLSLCFNPSHLEFVNPVLVGRVRARQDRLGDVQRQRVMGVLIHGDAAVAGEGIVQETLNLSELGAYHTGGTLHVVVNNQIGFTTSPHESRSSLYCTDVCKMLQIPIFHVNGEDPEAVAQVVNLAMDFRATFKRDVVIDMYGYRRHGHNEGDEPSFTQPILYKTVSSRHTTRDGYLEHLLKLEGVSRDEADRVAEARQTHLETALSHAREEDGHSPIASLKGIWSDYRGGSEDNAGECDTGIERAQLVSLLEAQAKLPEDFNLHRKLSRLMSARLQMASGERPLDWSTAEALAFASAAVEGYRIRFTGQDSARGTFSQRHAVIHDTVTGESYCPLQHLAARQAPVEIENSPLSETAVLGFEYGYSLDYPDGLVMWEAQFGDFVNVGQVIIDQFISSAEDKWRRLSGLTMLLPHGFEGQGPEHASARIERFLVLAAEDNLQIVMPSTPAQYFHVLRRQVVRPWRKPLIVFTPKSLLRHPEVVSPLDELAAGRFKAVIGDGAVEAKKVRRVLLCSGKIYYELVKRREALGRDDVAIVRLEQIYPLREAELAEAIQGYAENIPAIWVQEEPENMGAWRFLKVRCGEKLLGRFPFSGISRPESASPATGSHSSHKYEQEQLLLEAFEGQEVGD